MGTVEKGLRVHVEPNIPGSLQPDQKLVCKDTTLWYFDIQKPVTVQVDALKKGLGAALLQEGHPVAFASKAVTPTEK